METESRRGKNDEARVLRACSMRGSREAFGSSEVTMKRAFLVFVVTAAISCGSDGPTVPPPPTPPPTPTHLSPPNGVVFDHFPRTTTLAWSSVPGAVSYWVEVEGCSPAGCSPDTVFPLRRENLAATTYIFPFVGKQPGRWRVWAVGATGLESIRSDWWVFFYTI